MLGQRIQVHGRAAPTRGIPLYVLIDEFAEEGPTVFVHSDPEDGSYGKREQVAFGKPIELPEPFELSIPTDEF